MSARKPIAVVAAVAAVAAAATMALPVASAGAATTGGDRLSNEAIFNTAAGSPAGSLCLMLGAETQGSQLFGNPILTSRLQQTSGYMACG
jgi:hypothetical protein